MYNNVEYEKIKEKIIDYIKRNKVSSTEVADCLGKTGALKGVQSVNKGIFKVGPVKLVYAYDSSNWSVHEQVIDTQEGDIVLIEAHNCGDRAIIGELVTKYILTYRLAAAIVCNANYRDGNDIIKEKYPVWCKGFNPEGCFNIKNEKPLEEEVLKKYKNKYEGAVAVCDDTGVVLIGRENITDEFYQKLQDIEAQEDKWFECLDHRKWNTYEIVCLKKYLKDNEEK